MSVKKSIVEWFGGDGGDRCGYCKAPDTYFSHGMWGHTVTVQDYQDLIDRGWRRSGKYLYKPILPRVCCPMYTIRCSALDLTLSKSQRQIINRVNRFINQDIRPSAADVKQQQQHKPQPKPGIGADPNKPRYMKAKDLRKAKLEQKSKNSSAASKAADSASTAGNSAAKAADSASTAGNSAAKAADSAATASSAAVTHTTTAAGKAASTAVSGSEEQSLEDLLNYRVEKPAHKLELRLVRSSPRSELFENTLASSHSLYTRYQTSVHHDKPDEVTMEQFTGFLVKSPLIPESSPNSDEELFGYGSYHRQYWLDGVLIAVGVLDILPHCVSSVYLYYDPEYSFLSLGTYSALQELALTRALHRSLSPQISYYYMGFYIHSCPKMRYKGQYYPSYLACPETYQWFPLSHCKSLLDKNKYSRFNPDPVQGDADTERLDVDSVLCLYSNTVMLFSQYCAKKRQEGEEEVGPGDRESVALYARLTGSKCAQRMLLFRD